MVDSYRLSNALSALGQGLDQFSKMQFSDQENKQKMALEQRREAANQQFHAMLQQNMIQNENARQDKQLAETAKDRELSRQLSADNKAATIGMEQKRLDSEDAYRQQQLGMEGARLGLERDRLSTSKADATKMRAATIIQARLTGLDRSMQAYSAQANKEKEDLQKSMDFMSMDDAGKQAAMGKIDSKYSQVITHQQKLRDVYNNKLAELTGTDLSEDDGGGSQAGDVNTDGGMPPAPAGIGATPTPSGQMPPKPPSLSGAPATQAPATPQAPFPEGARLMGKDGKTYVVKGGKPVPEGQ